MKHVNPPLTLLIRRVYSQVTFLLEYLGRFDHLTCRKDLTGFLAKPDHLDTTRILKRANRSLEESSNDGRYGGIARGKLG